MNLAVIVTHNFLPKMLSVIKNSSSRIPAKNVLNCCNQYTRERAIHYVSNTQRLPNLTRHRRSPVLTQCFVQRAAYCSSRENRDPLVDFAALYPLSPYEITDITGGDPNLERKLRALQMELAVESLRKSRQLPKHISFENWKRLFILSRSERKKALIILTRKERAKELQNQIDDDCLEEPDVEDDRCNPKSIFEYKLFRNAMFPMIHDSCMTESQNRKLAEALDFNQTLVMDCGFEQVMSPRDVNNTCQQVGFTVNANRTSVNPFNMVFCNLDKGSQFYRTLWTSMPNLDSETLPLVTTEKCYTEIFPKERLVYLTPHTRNEIEYNPKDIYIIGTMVDKSNPGPHTLIKSKIQGIRMGAFPLDKYLLWKSGTKSLTLNQVVRILLAMKDTGDWEQAFKAVPQRKVVYRNNEVFENKQRMFRRFV